MSNPFDQFAADFQAALPAGAPGTTAPAPAPFDAGNPFASGYAAPPSSQQVPPSPTPPKPVMNSPPAMPSYNGGGYGAASMGGGPPPPMGGPPMGGMGGPPPSMYGGMDQGQQQPQYGMMGSNGMMGSAPSMGGPPPGAPTMNGMGSPPPMQGSMNGMGGMGSMGSSMGGMGSSMGGMGSMGGGMNGANPNPMGGAPPPPAPAADPSLGALVPSAPPAGAPPPGHDPFSSFGGAPPAPPQPAGPPQGLPPSNSFDGGLGAPQGQQQPPPGADPFASYGAPAAPPQPPAANDAYPGAPPPGQPPSYPGAPPPGHQPAADPFASYGAPAPQAPQPPVANDAFGGYGQPSSAPYGQPPAAPPAQPTQALAPAADPFGGGYGAPPSGPYGAPTPPGPPAAPPAYADPWGGAPGAPPADPNLGALVPSQQPNQPYAQLPPQQQPPVAADPFAVFNAPQPAPPPPAAQPPAPQQAPAPAGGDDLWGDLGFDAPPSAGAPPPAAPQAEAPAAKPERRDHGEKKEDGLPPGGEWYDARIFTPTLGVMFFKPQELTDSLFLNTERSIVDQLGERPVVAFIVEGSSARSAGVELGHVLLKVNGVDVRNPKEASRLIKEGPRPLPLLFYVPNTDVIVAEGEHMVKYDTRETTAPNSAKDWKPKYVVIGGIIAQPWMMNMYRSKSEYDIAVIETQARRPVSVKVKQFSLQGARIQNDWQGPQMVKYKNKLHPWKYIVVLPVARNPIKISSPNLAHLKPVHEGIRRVLLAQQRERGGNPHAAAPVRNREAYNRPQYHSDPYAQRAQNAQGHDDPYGRGRGGY